MEQQKIDAVLAIVNQGLAGVEEVTLLNTPNPNGTTLRFFAEGNAIQIVEGLLAQAELDGLFFDVSEDKKTWLLDYFYETNKRTETV